MTRPLTPSTAWRDFLPAVVFTLLSGVVVFTATMQPPAKGEMAVVFPPATSELTAWALVRQAGGLIVSPTRLSNVVVAYAPDTGFETRVRQLGALFLFAAKGLCAPRVKS